MKYMSFVAAIGAMAGAIAEAYYSRCGLSRFEKNFIHSMIDSDDEEFIKEFHKTIGSKKFIEQGEQQ